MNRTVESPPNGISGLREFVAFFIGELKPKGKLLTPFNVISSVIMAVAIVLLVIRFTKGLGAITNLSQESPWGVWIGFDVVTGVAFAGGAYIVTFLVYILGAKKYYPIVRATVLNGFLAYVFYAGALLLDLGRPWNVVNPIIGNSFGVSSVLFLVAWHFLLYMLAELIEFSPAVAEWLGWKRTRRVLHGLTLGAVIFGITLSTLHQSGLGALYMMAKSKIHPLWYTEFIPVLFFVSSTFAGLSMVILEGSLSHKVFKHRVGKTQHASHDGILLGLGRFCAVMMFVYFFFKVLILIHNQQFPMLATGWGYWYMVELIGFVLVPGYLYYHAVQFENLKLIRIAAILTLVGIILNRLNVTTIGFQWQSETPYFPTWMEIEVTLAVICAEIWAFRWVVNRMAVLGDPPRWVTEDEEH